MTFMEIIQQIVEKEFEDVNYSEKVKVVLCKDCKYLSIKDLCYGYCDARMTGIVEPDDYCSFGEIKNED